MAIELSVKKSYSGFSNISDWFSSGRYFNEDSFTTRIRYFQITAFSFLFITSFINFLLRAETSYTITATACMALIAVRFLLDNSRVKAAYFLMLLSINAALILLTSLKGLHSGVFLYFFPCIISFGFIADMTKPNNVLLTYVAGIGSFMVAILIAPGNTNLNQVVSGAGWNNISINIVVSFFMVGWMSYTLAKENSRKQSILMNKEIFLDTIFNSSLHTEIIVETDNGLISSYNRHATSLLAAGEGHLLDNRPVRDLFPDLAEDERGDFPEALFYPAANWEGELTCMRIDGTIFPGQISLVSFEYLGRNFKKITIVDITEKNQILSELQEAKIKAEESVYIKSQFLSHMSHELRTPLNGIIGSTNLLLQDDHSEEQKEQLNVLRFSSEHMLSLINDILDLSKLEANKIQLEEAIVEIPGFVHKVAAPFLQQYEDRGVDFQLVVDENINTALLADPTRLNQVLTNLLSNALKFTAKGSVKLELKALSFNNESNTIEFSVTDTGIGIANDKKNKIFEQFSQADVKTTRKYGGTGLGLTISQELVKLMGGELKVESKYQKGSRFYFTVNLPVHIRSVKKMYVSADDLFVDEQQLKSIKVLIAEDNPINMMIATKFLDKWGVVYEKAKNGVEAVSLFNLGSFDLVLMDIQMPEMDGYTALSKIRNIDADIPAIAFTAAVFENMKETLNKSGFNDYIQKPFRPKDLQSKLVEFSQQRAKSKIA
ncbi:MAG: ATP-binding protein [Bacteroidota bacterium]